jgi:hypothetical protein
MGIFFRKSFRVGPLRFNLSKSGVGVSTGIKGARVGIGARGPYVSGGKDGIYFRENLGSGGNASESNGSNLAAVFFGVLLLLVGLIVLIAVDLLLWIFSRS